VSGFFIRKYEHPAGKVKDMYKPMATGGVSDIITNSESEKPNRRP